ncbi:hypothetical protein IFO70_30640 [Phormidium tenue FACHB-886]|nr:hypothetical protein [Phormidium tenue FACHB-886]
MEKNLAQTVDEVRCQHPDAEVEVWAEDEHRVGLHPVNRRVWTPANEPPLAQVNCKYQWMWLAGFVCPTRGETYWWIVPSLSYKGCGSVSRSSDSSSPTGGDING